jgi:hypothetical protein
MLDPVAERPEHGCPFVPRARAVLALRLPKHARLLLVLLAELVSLRLDRWTVNLPGRCGHDVFFWLAGKRLCMRCGVMF